MEVFDGHSSLRAEPSIARRNHVVALGNFDGVHVGHRALLSRACERATALEGAAAAVLTFDPHPAMVLAPALAPKMISSLARRIELFEEMGIEACVVEPFTKDLAGLSPQAFFDDILISAVRSVHIVVGYDFTFGRKRSGTTETLRELAAAAGIEVTVVDPVDVDGIVASSTKVRNFIGDGNMSGARLVLGRNYDIDGVIVRGEQRGRELGYPTANVDPDIDIIAPTGIYAAWATVLDGPLAGTRRMAATSLGTNPTFDADKRTLEPHLLDFEGDLYGARMRVELVEYLRPERRFSSLEALVRAIDEDVEQTRTALTTDRQP